MTSPKRVASSFEVVDSSGAFFPHLYERDIDHVQRVIERCMQKKDDRELNDFAVTLQRLLDWIIAESRAVAFTVRMIAERQEDGTVVVRNIDTGICGTPQDNVVVALDACAEEMRSVLTALEEMPEEEQDTLDWAKGVLYWAENFPPGEKDE